MLVGWLMVTMFLWWFALYQTPEAAPDWLVRARAVCFGTDETGLPDTYGWWVLILAPLSFLAALLVTFSSELTEGVPKASASTAGKFNLLLLTLLVITECAWATQRIREGLAIANADYGPDISTALPEGYPKTMRPAPPFALVDQDGQRVSLEELKGNSVILTFAFAHCKTVCPTLVNTGRMAMNELAEDRARLLVITLDPWRDTPGALPSLAKRWKFSKKSHLLSGEVSEVNNVLASYNVPTTRSDKTGDIVHPALVYILDPDMKIAYTFNNPPRSWLTQAVRNTLRDPYEYTKNG